MNRRITVYPFRTTTHDCLLTTKHGAAEAHIDHLRQVIWIDGRLDPARQELVRAYALLHLHDKAVKKRRRRGESA